MGKIIVTRGVPASGKSTWAKQWVADAPSNRGRVNRDVREMIGITTGIGSHEQEQIVSSIEEKAVAAFLSKGYDVVVDATHLKAAFAKKWFDYGDEVQFVDLPITFINAVSRDLQRKTQGQRYVGSDVIEMFFTRFRINKDTGELPGPPVRNAVPGRVFQPYTPDESLPKAIILDIDGTIAIFNGRGPYERDKYHTDLVDPTVHQIVKWAQAEGIFVLATTGRDARWRQETMDWFSKHGISPFALFMRPAKDERQDAIVKNELFEQKIRDSYNVLFALDDRNQVVDMWRAKGIKVLQVADGNF